MKAVEQITAEALFSAADRNRQTPASRLVELGLPGNKTEPYRHFAVKPLLAKDYTQLAPEQGDIAESEALVIENGAVISAPADVNIVFDTRWISDPIHFDALYYLGHLMAPRLIRIKASGHLPIIHRITEPQKMLTYRLFVDVAENTQLTVFETFETDGSADSLVLYGLDTAVEPYATLDWIRHQHSRSNEATVIGSHRIAAEKNAQLAFKTFDFGDGSALHLYKIDLDEHARGDVNHLIYGAGKARRGNVVNLRHNGRHSRSNHQAKSILKDTATGIFNGLIRVDQNAKYTAAHQNSKAILLNNEAYMDSRPQLEIYIDELEASHGSTTGQLDDAALFYLRSRGIEEKTARQILIRAFAEDMISAVTDDSIAMRIQSDLDSEFLQ